MKPKHLLFPLTLSLLTACQPKAEVDTEIPVANIRELIANPSTLSLNEEIKQVEYIPLRQQGIEQGLEQGLEQGAYQNKLETAKRMIGLGISLEQVQLCTNLPLDVVQGLL